MKELFLILFFSKTVLLTPTPISIDKEWIEIEAEKSFSAITGGAAIYLDVSAYIPKDYELIEQFDEVKRIFPDNTVTGVMIAENGTEFKIQNKGSSHSKSDVRLIMDYGSSMPTDINFKKLKLKSNKELKGINVYWKNFKM